MPSSRAHIWQSHRIVYITINISHTGAQEHFLAMLCSCSTALMESGAASDSTCMMYSAVCLMRPMNLGPPLKLGSSNDRARVLES